MGRSKPEMKKVHKKSVDKAKNQVKEYGEKKLTYQKLNSLGRKMLKKQQRALNNSSKEK